MAYISQYEIDKRQDAEMNNIYRGIGDAATSYFDNNRKRALEAKRQQERQSDQALAFAKEGIGADQIAEFQNTGDTSGIAKLYQEKKQSETARLAEERALNKRAKEAQIAADYAVAREKGLPVEETREFKEYVAKKEYDNKNLRQGKNAQEFDSRMQNILGEAEQLKSLINDKGTFEAFGPHNATLAQKVDAIAIDAAKLFDPESVARDSEVAAFRKMLFEPGSLSTSNNTAIGTVDGFKKLVMDRAARSRGEQPQGDIQAPPPQDPIAQQKLQRLQQLRAKKAGMAMGGQ
jgi:hypothetical protein